MLGVFGAAIAGSVTADQRQDSRADSRPGILPTPNFDRSRVIRFVAGLRPYRTGGIRIEREEVAGKSIVHDYGHGGAGFTLSWGSAEAAVDLITDLKPPGPVAVLGAGVIGLSTARVLQERGFAVRLYAEDFPPNTTSNLAGAEWMPASVDIGDSDAAKALFAQIARRSWARFEALVGDPWGVSVREAFEAESTGTKSNDLARAVMPAGTRLDRLPFAGRPRAGHVVKTFLIEPPRYLPALMRSVLRGGAHLEARTFGSPDDVARLPERIVFDCLGLGAKVVFADAAVLPIRGQLVHSFPERLPYLLMFAGGYVFPRSDALVLGGTFERGETSTEPDPKRCEQIWETNRAFFAE